MIALAVSFFVGGQELRRIFGRRKVAIDDSVSDVTDQVVFGTLHT